MVLFGQYPECHEIHMIIVIVREEDSIDRREILEPDTWLCISTRSCPLYWTRSFAPDGISEQIDPVSLDE